MYCLLECSYSFLAMFTERYQLDLSIKELERLIITKKKPSLKSEGFSQQGGKNELTIRPITKLYTVAF